MTPEERTLLTGLFDRVRQASTGSRDREAEALIAEQVRTQPAAPYLLAQTVIVQDQALRAANERLQQLEQQVRDSAERSDTSGSFLGGIGKSLFGGAASVQPAPAAGAALEAARAPGGPWGRTTPQPPNAPAAWSQPAPGAGWGNAAPQAPGGGTFLKGALGAAAGVAGGVLLADSIRGLFSGHGGGGLGIGSGFASPMGAGGETIINNYYESPADTQTAGYDQADQPGADYASAADYGSNDPGYSDASGYDNGGDFGNSDPGTYDV